MTAHKIPGSALRSPLPAISLMELRMGLRAGVFRFGAAVLFLLGWSIGGAGGRGVGMSAYSAGEIACQQLGIATVFWVALGAVRDTSLRTATLVFTKPQPPERLALARFLGLFGQVMCFLLALFVGAIVGRLFTAGNLLGFPAYGLQYLRAVGVLFFASSAAYCLALLADSPLAGGLVALYWVVAMAGRDYLAKYYFPWYAQNLPAYILFGVALLGFALWFSRRKQRGDQLAALWVRIVAPAALVCGAWSLWIAIRDGHDPMALRNHALERMSEQNIVVGNLTPGFLLPDQNGKPIALSQFPGRILVIALWSPRDQDSTVMLSRLDATYRRYRDRGVLPIAICLSEDNGAAATFAAGERLSFPMVDDWGTYHGSRQIESSPLAVAYLAAHLPRIVITDRRHRVRAILEDLATSEGPAFDNELAQRLAEEPH